MAKQERESLLNPEQNRGIVINPNMDELWEFIRSYQGEVVISKTAINDSLLESEQTKIIHKGNRIGIISKMTHSDEKLLKDNGFYNCVPFSDMRELMNTYTDDHTLSFPNRGILHDRSWDEDAPDDYRIPGFYLMILDNDCRAVVRLGLSKEEIKHQKITEWASTNPFPDRGELSNREFEPLVKEYTAKRQEFKSNIKESDLKNNFVLLDASRGTIVTGGQGDFNELLHNYAAAYKITLESLYKSQGISIPNLEINFKIQEVQKSPDQDAIADEQNLEKLNKGLHVLIEDANTIYETAGSLSASCEEQIWDMYRRLGPPRGGYGTDDIAQEISHHNFANIPNSPILEEQTSIIGNWNYREGFSNSGSGRLFSCKSIIKPSFVQDNEFGYISDEKIDEIIETLRKAGLTVEKEIWPNGFLRGGERHINISCRDINFRVWPGPSSREAEEVYLTESLIFNDRCKQIKSGLFNEKIELEFAGIPHLGSESDFENQIKAYAYVYESLINVLYPNMQGQITLGPSAETSEGGGEWTSKEDFGTSSLEVFNNICGQDEAVIEARKIVQAIKNPEAYKKRGVKVPKGILFYGPPGTGKTMLARAIAQASGARLVEISVADVGSKWHGESEKMLQQIFSDAGSNGKTILFFDEFDSFAPPRDDSYEITRKLIAVFNQNMDGIRSNPDVTVIAATNRPEGIDLAAKRSGRFDKMVEVPLPNPEGRIAILKKHMEKAVKESSEPGTLFAKEINFEEVAKETNGMSGADLANLVNQVLEQKLTDELKGKAWTPVNTEEMIDTANKIILSRTESVAISFPKK